MAHRTPFAILLTMCFVFGTAGAAHAQTPAVQKALEEVKTKLDDLVSAKDENPSNDLALRVQAFKKVVELSLEETKTLRVKLLATEFERADKKALAAWKTRMAEELSAAGAYYEGMLAALTTSTPPIDLPGVKALAASFKEWRETTFLPLAREAEEFLLVAGQANTLKVASVRLMKIKEDVKKLERAKVKGLEKLAALLAKAGARMESASRAYERAETAFAARIAPPEAMEASERATSTVEEAALPSIHDEIKASLNAVKDAYQTFIEMSGEVKRILK